MMQKARAHVAASGLGDFEKPSDHRRRANPGVEKKQGWVSNAIEGLSALDDINPSAIIFPLSLPRHLSHLTLPQ
jgi:hypothetical protein